MAAVAAVLVGMVAPHQLRIAAAQRVAVAVLAQPEHRQGAPLGLGEARLRPFAGEAEARGNRVERVGEIAPRRSRSGGRRESADRALPPTIWRLGLADLFGAHAIEIIVRAIVLADMVEAQEAPAPRPVEIGRLERRLKLAGLAAAGDRAAVARSLDPSVHPWVTRSHLPFPLVEPLYIGRMNAPSTGPVATEMLRRLDAALGPSRVELIDDSEAHRGHGGHNP